MEGVIHQPDSGVQNGGAEDAGAQPSLSTILQAVPTLWDYLLISDAKNLQLTHRLARNQYVCWCPKLRLRGTKQFRANSVVNCLKKLVALGYRPRNVEILCSNFLPPGNVIHPIIEAWGARLTTLSLVTDPASTDRGDPLGFLKAPDWPDRVASSLPALHTLALPLAEKPVAVRLQPLVTRLGPQLRRLSLQMLWTRWLPSWLADCPSLEHLALDCRSNQGGYWEGDEGGDMYGPNGEGAESSAEQISALTTLRSLALSSEDEAMLNGVRAPERELEALSALTGLTRLFLYLPHPYLDMECTEVTDDNSEMSEFAQHCWPVAAMVHGMTGLAELLLPRSYISARDCAALAAHTALTQLKCLGLATPPPDRCGEGAAAAAAAAVVAAAAVEAAARRRRLRRPRGRHQFPLRLYDAGEDYDFGDSGGSDSAEEHHQQQEAEDHEEAEPAGRRRGAGSGAVRGGSAGTSSGACGVVSGRAAVAEAPKVPLPPNLRELQVHHLPTLHMAACLAALPSRPRLTLYLDEWDDTASTSPCTIEVTVSLLGGAACRYGNALPSHNGAVQPWLAPAAAAGARYLAAAVAEWTERQRGGKSAAGGSGGGGSSRPRPVAGPLVFIKCLRAFEGYSEAAVRFNRKQILVCEAAEAYGLSNDWCRNNQWKRRWTKPSHRYDKVGVDFDTDDDICEAECLSDFHECGGCYRHWHRLQHRDEVRSRPVVGPHAAWLAELAALGLTVPALGATRDLVLAPGDADTLRDLQMASGSCTSNKKKKKMSKRDDNQDNVSNKKSKTDNDDGGAPKPSVDGQRGNGAAQAGPNARQGGGAQPLRPAVAPAPQSTTAPTAGGQPPSRGVATTRGVPLGHSREAKDAAATSRTPPQAGNGSASQTGDAPQRPRDTQGGHRGAQRPWVQPGPAPGGGGPGSGGPGAKERGGWGRYNNREAYHQAGQWEALPRGSREQWGGHAHGQVATQWGGQPQAPRGHWGGQPQAPGGHWGGQPQAPGGHWGGQPQAPGGQWGGQPQAPGGQWGGQPQGYGGQWSRFPYGHGGQW